ncbi:Leucine-rich repeat protein kinase family protein [Thalictrum thalictroides]|uniref:Leucine-rich repeat protein kinase family protein n=1 Tax=Thalictrum thalictroides TaxID=46969 RepID=A0A7J6VUC6_THATH|nr:Leucine-rich repeat protein kinase family protein [Thalictrum thalictroides]
MSSFFFFFIFILSFLSLLLLISSQTHYPYVYDNYDSKLHSPSFDVSIEGTVVFPWRSPWPQDVNKNGAFSDLIAFVNDGEADVCFYSIATDPPVIGSLEIIQIDPLSYDSASVGNHVLLVNFGRFSCGYDSSGLGFSNVDRFGRRWKSDRGYRVYFSNPNLVKDLGTKRSILGTNQQPNYFPTELYQTAVTHLGNGVLEYELSVDAKRDYLVWFHFAEIDSSVNSAGKRVFDILINEKKVNTIDIFKQVGSFTALNWHYTIKNLNSTTLSVKLVPVIGAPIISGLENYALVPKDLSTVRDQVVAMRALKESLRVPDRMGWNGDPCGPSTWDAWEGVTCHTNKDKSALVVSQIDLGSQGLKGYISDQISLLQNLVSLNLSSNSLEGTLPPGLGQRSLVRLDLSNNKFSGPIPDSLTISSLQLVLLNDNELEGIVPEKVYSIGVHGGAIDLSGNKGLCGVPSLPACPLFWKNGGLSTAGKVSIGVTCFVILGIMVVMVCICVKRRRNDYEFAPPQDLISISAKRNRYHRQKSMMLLEMEQSPTRFSTTLNPL